MASTAVSLTITVNNDSLTSAVRSALESAILATAEQAARRELRRQLAALNDGEVKS